MSGPSPDGRGSGRVGIVEGWELRHGHKQDANSGAFKGLAFVLLAIVLIAVAGWYVGRPMVGPTAARFFEESPGIVNLPLVDDLLAVEFGDRLDQPAGTSDREIEFIIEPGQKIEEIEENLVDLGLLTDPLALRYAVVRDRVDELIKAGPYTMTPQITPAGIAQRLALPPDAPTPVTVLDMRQGRRIEQVVAYLQQETEQKDPQKALELIPRSSCA